MKPDQWKLDALLAQYLALVMADQADGPCKRTEEAYAEITDALLRDGVTIARAFNAGFVPCDESDPYADLLDLHDAATRSIFPVEVSDVNHNGAFLGNDAANFRFRAHHDAVHVLLLAPMSLEGETHVARYTTRLLDLGKDAAAVLAAEIVGQALYFECFRRFPLVGGRQPFARPTPELVQWARDAYHAILEGEHA